MSTTYKSLLNIALRIPSRNELAKKDYGLKRESFTEISVLSFPSRQPAPPREEDVDIGKIMMSLREGDAAQKAAAARTIGDLAFMKKKKIPEAIWPLAVLLRMDDDEYVREEAAWALWKLGDKRAAESLLHALANDRSFIVKEVAARSLGLLGAKEAVPLMMALLSLGRMLPARLRASLVSSLGLLANERAARVLLKAATDTEPIIRHEAVRSLGRYLSTSSPQIVEKCFLQIVRSANPLLEGVADIRNAAICALRMSHDRRARTVIMKSAVCDPDASTRKQALETLLFYSGPDTETTLLKALEDRNWGVRKIAARVLAEFVRRLSVYNAPRVSEAFSRMERMFPSGSREWRLAADAFASL